MRILFTIEHYFPQIGGAEEVVKKVAERLSKRGHRVTVATSYVAERTYQAFNGVKIASFNIQGNRAKGISGEIKKYKNFLIASDFDVVCNYAAQSWSTDLTFEVLDQIKAKKVLLPCGYSGLALWSKRPFYWNYFRKLPVYLKKYDHIIYHSANYIDKAYGDKHGIKCYSIIPNGIDLDEMQSHVMMFREYYNISTEYMLLNVSNHYKLKGHSFIIRAFNMINKDDVTLVIIGNKILGRRGCNGRCEDAASKNQRILLLNNVQREHVVSAFNEADIFVFGSKVECFPLVILEVLEAMSVGLPFLSTDVGCVKDMQGGMIVSSPKEMSIRIAELLSDGNLRHKLGAKGEKECLSKYTWETVVNRYEDIFLNLVSKN